MTGGLMQLVAFGAQDIYLTGNPMITFFKVVYRRHTNFAMESILQTFAGNANFGSTMSALISRNGDLISNITLEATLPALATDFRWTDNIGHYLISSTEISIGGQAIDTHYSDWLEIWSQLSVPAGQYEGYLHMIGQDEKDSMGQPTGLQLSNTAVNDDGGRTIYVPLQFWFCRNIGLALPLIALQYHEVKIQITMAPLSYLSMSQDGTRNTEVASLVDVGLWVDYIYLDTDERRRFAQVSHEYLIEQLQTTGDVAISGTTMAVNLNFNHPIKELIWFCRAHASSASNQWNNYTTTQADTSVLPIVNIIPEINMVTTAAGERIWALTAANTEPECVITKTGDLYTSTITNIAHTHSVRVMGNTETANIDHTHRGYTAGNVYAADTGPMQSNNPHSHAIDFTVTSGSTDPTGGHSHNYYIPALYTDGTPIQSMDFGMDYGNGHTPDVTVSNSSATTFVSADADLLTSTHAGTSLASVTSKHDFVTGGQLVSEAVNPVTTAKLQLNGQDRFASRKGGYFNMVQPLVHTKCPVSRGINVYSFALKPEDHQPSGACNFSRIDTARLQVTLSLSTGIIKVYAINYNVLRIMSGMGGLAYSN